VLYEQKKTDVAPVKELAQAGAKNQTTHVRAVYDVWLSAICKSPLDAAYFSQNPAICDRVQFVFGDLNPGMQTFRRIVKASATSRER